MPNFNEPVVVDLTANGDGYILKVNGVPKAIIRVDTEGRAAIIGPDGTPMLTMSGRGRATVGAPFATGVGPEPATDPVRLLVQDDLWATGTIRAGIPGAFGSAPIDPRGALQLGRNHAPQTASYIRFYHLSEQARIGLTAADEPFISPIPNDDPTFFRIAKDGTVYVRRLVQTAG